MGDEANLSTAQIDGLLADTRRVLERMRTQAPPPAEPLRGEGEAPGGKARAVVVSPGRIESLQVEPRLLREGSEKVCATITEAVNLALADLLKRARSDPSIDPQGLAGELEKLQEQSLDSARSMMAVLQDAMDRVERRI